MEKLPETSSSSVKKGSWYVFKDGKDMIRLWMSNKGKEKLYFNDKLVSEREKLVKTKTEHTFVSSKDDRFKITVVGSFKFNEAGAICSLYKNGEHSQELKIIQNKNFMKEIRLILYPTLLIYIICILVRVMNDFPIYILFLPVIFFAIMLVRFVRMKIPLIKVENTTAFIED